MMTTPSYPNFYYDWINADWQLSRIAPITFEVILPSIYRWLQITNEEDFGHD